MTLDEYLTEYNRAAEAAGKPKLRDADFGALIDLSQSQVSRLRRGESCPSWKTLKAISRESGGKVQPTFEDWPALAEAAE